MLPFPAFAFVDLETTGTNAARDRITEIGIVRVDCAADRMVRVSEWGSLIDPECPIPPAIQALTGITDAMVAAAPSFSRVAGQILERLGTAVFVAHNARFDYGFLKQAFARIGRPFSSRVLCTVRLSRNLFPDDAGHGLDALIARHGLSVSDRHRALGDARAIWSFVELLYRQQPREHVDAVIRRLLRVPSLPPQLASDAIDTLPEGPGVYLFYGENPMPLYIGKSINLRERVAAHFCHDWRTESDSRLSLEIRRIEHERTAGELGALLRESILVKSRLPAHNRTLRRKEQAGIAEWVDAKLRFVPACAIDPSRLSGALGPFASRASLRAMLRQLASEHRLCPLRLGLERRSGGPCFARQIRRCDGVCVGEESPASHDARVAAALEPLVIPKWPVAGAGLVRECSPDGDRIDVHVFRDWCWAGTATDDGALNDLVETPQRAEFDLDVTRLLLRRHRHGMLELLAGGSPRSV